MTSDDAREAEIRAFAAEWHSDVVEPVVRKLSFVLRLLDTTRAQLAAEKERCDLLAEEIAHLRDDMTEVDRQFSAEKVKSEGMGALLRRFLDCPEIADAGQENMDEETIVLERETRKALSASPEPGDERTP